MENKITKILLMGKNGEYNIAQKTKDGLNLEISSEKVFVREVIPYGFDFTFGDSLENKSFDTFGYTHSFYSDKGKDGKYPKTNEEYGQINLESTIKGLENEVKETGADFILIDRFISDDYSTYWKVSGRAQLLIKR